MQEHLGSSIKDIGVGNEFLNMSPLDKEINQTINKYNLIKLKNASVKLKKSLNENHMGCERIFANHRIDSINI